MNFYSILQKIQTEDITQTELNRFIEKFFQIALRFVRYNSGRIKKVTSEYNSEVLEDIAVDSIVPLFTRNQGDGRYYIASQFESWVPVITTEEDARYFVIKIVSLSVTQKINTLLKEFDPFFSKILDSVNYFIKTQNYKKTNITSRIYITEQDFTLTRSVIIDRDLLFDSPVDLFISKKDMLPSLFTYYRKSREGSVAIALYDLIYRLKELNFSGQYFQQAEDPSDVLVIKDIINKGFSGVYERIEESYLSSGKLNRDEFTGMMQALRLIGSDLMDGGINPGLYHYLYETMPGLTKDEYEDKYHNIFEYIVKLYRQSLAEIIG
jgi:hypothetical protein